MVSVALSSERPVRVLCSDADYGIALATRTLVVYWNDETSTSAVANFAELVRESRHQCGALGLLQIIGSRASPPSSEARQGLANMLRANEDFIVASAVVFEATGFRASLIRSIFIGISMLSRTKYPHVVFPSVFTGVDWLAGYFTDVPHYAASVHEAIALLRESFPAG